MKLENWKMDRSGARGTERTPVEWGIGHTRAGNHRLWRTIHVKRFAAAVITLSTLGILAVAVAASPASAAQVCVYADVNVNGNAQSIAQCLPE